MRVVVLWEPDTEMPDPERGHPAGVQTYEFVDTDADCFVVWREWGDEFEGGYRDHITGQGIWENLTMEQMDEALAAITATE